MDRGVPAADELSSVVDASPVDPRRLRWEIDAPTFLVTFYDLPADATRDLSGSVATDEWRVSGPDVRAVLRWAEQQAGVDRTFGLHVIVEAGATLADGPGIVRLAGRDPNGSGGAPI